jgi:hypothetical protein
MRAGLELTYVIDRGLGHAKSVDFPKDLLRRISG